MGAAQILKLPCRKLFSQLAKEEAGRLLVEAVRWPDGKPVCPCGYKSDVVELGRAGLFRCGCCQWDFSVRADTIFSASKIGLHHWIWAICMVAEEGEKLTSVRLSKVLGITQKSAWLMLERIRGRRRVYLHLLDRRHPRPVGRIGKVHQQKARRMRAFARQRSITSFRRLIAAC